MTPGLGWSPWRADSYQNSNHKLNISWLGNGRSQLSNFRTALDSLKSTPGYLPGGHGISHAQPPAPAHPPAFIDVDRRRGQPHAGTVVAPCRAAPWLRPPCRTLPWPSAACDARRWFCCWNLRWRPDPGPRLHWRRHSYRTRNCCLNRDRSCTDATCCTCSSYRIDWSIDHWRRPKIWMSGCGLLLLIRCQLTSWTRRIK